MRAIVLIQFLFASMVWAQDISVTRWQEYFAGSPHQPTKESLVGFLKYDISCEKIVEKVARYTFQYGELSNSDKNGASARKSNAIQTLLRSLENKNSPCFTPAAHAYIAISTLLIDPSANMKDNRNTVYIDTTLAALSIAIMNRGFVHPVKSSERKSWAGKWTEHRVGARYPNVLGAYDCSQSRIYIDPYLAPIDLAAVFTHELDHLFRDKYLNDSKYLDNPRNYTLLDESLAVLLSVGLEYSLGKYSMGLIFASPLKQAWPFLFVPFRSLKDRTLYDREKSVWLKFADDMMIHKSEGFPWNGAGLVVTNEGDKFYRHHTARKTNFKMQYLEYVYSTLASSYFKSDFRTQTDWLDSNNHSNELLKLADVLKQISVVNIYPYYQTRTSTNRMLDIEKAISELEIIFSQHVTSQPSNLCQSFVDSLERGELDDYTGKNLGSPGQDSVRPGQEGVRPSKNVRPCINVYDSL